MIVKAAPPPRPRTSCWETALDEVSRYLGHSSTDVTRRYARQTPETLGRRAAEALERAGVTSG